MGGVKFKFLPAATVVMPVSTIVWREPNESAVDKVLAAHKKAVADYKAGQQKSFGFLVGQTMKELKGKGNPQMINDILRKKLSS